MHSTIITDKNYWGKYWIFIQKLIFLSLVTLRLLLTCFSECIYKDTENQGNSGRQLSNRWIKFFTSHENRHTLPIFTSLLNTVCGYQPSSVLPYNHLLWADSKEKLVEISLQVLIVTLDDYKGNHSDSPPDNLFINYLSRIHRDEDFQFILSGLTRLLMNPLTQTYLPGSQKKVFTYTYYCLNKKH